MSSETSSPKISSYRLYIIGKSISGNLPYLELEDNLLQIEACEDCFHVGCSSEGYVQVLTQGEIYLWKEPFITKGRSLERLER